MVELSLKTWRNRAGAEDVIHLHVDVAAANDAAARRPGGLVSPVAQSRLSKSFTTLVFFSQFAAPSKPKGRIASRTWGENERPNQARSARAKA